MSRQGWEKWWWNAWLTDTALQGTSESTRGIWINLLGYMWVDDVSELKLSTRQFCQFGNCSEASMEVFLDEAQALGFCYASREPNGHITVTSRRRKRGEKTRKNNALRQRRYYASRKPNAPNDGVEVDVDVEEERKIPLTGYEKKAKPASQRSQGQSPRQTGTNPRRSPPSASPVVPEGLCRESWEGYLIHRRENRMRVLKPKSQERLMRWLAEQGPPETQAAIVDQTVRNGWTGLFELKTTKPNGSDYDKPIRGSFEWQTERARERLERIEASEVLGSDEAPVRQALGTGTRTRD